ncbi:MAG: hypothetical protein HYX29_08890 [Solirubrobacterales bacterium]|nr:hypothetical protein [Solirubrobacterales bacterium]
MAALSWVLMALAIWHFAVYLPEKFWGGIVGAFAAAIAGAVIFGFIVNGFSVPGRDDTDLIQAIIAIPGAGIGLGISYFIGMRQEAAEKEAV